MNPLYCGVLTAETLLLNRRRHTLSCRKKRESGNRIYYRLDNHEHRRDADCDYVTGSDTYAEIRESRFASGQTLDEESAYGGTKTKKGDEDIPLIYACATMWHETRREMIALLKSVHR